MDGLLGELLGTETMERRDRRREPEFYTIRPVVKLTGVPDYTIRSWERRSGFPRPERTPGNQCRCLQRGIDAIRSIQAARQAAGTESIAMDQAIRAPNCLGTNGAAVERDSILTISIQESMLNAHYMSIHLGGAS